MAEFVHMPFNDFPAGESKIGYALAVKLSGTLA